MFFTLSLHNRPHLPASPCFPRVTAWTRVKSKAYEQTVVVIVGSKGICNAHAFNAGAEAQCSTLGTLVPSYSPCTHVGAAFKQATRVTILPCLFFFFSFFYQAVRPKALDRKPAYLRSCRILLRGKTKRDSVSAVRRLGLSCWMFRISCSRTARRAARFSFSLHALVLYGLFYVQPHWKRRIELSLIRL